MSGQMVRPPAYQVLADELRDEITSGRLRPGERLPAEPDLCVRSGVSRSTVREALRLLASQNLIVTTRGVTGGSFVAQPDAGQLSDAISTGLSMLKSTDSVSLPDLLEIRRALEVPAAALAAPRRTTEHLAALRSALLDPADDGRSMIDKHSAFHSTVAAATGNPLFELLSRPLYEVSYTDEALVAVPRPYWAQLDRDHRELLAALTASDADAAAAVARKHIDFIAETYGC